MSGSSPPLAPGPGHEGQPDSGAVCGAQPGRTRLCIQYSVFFARKMDPGAADDVRRHGGPPGTGGAASVPEEIGRTVMGDSSSTVAGEEILPGQAASGSGQTVATD